MQSENRIEDGGAQAFGAALVQNTTLSTLNLTIVTRVLSLPYGFKSPFRAEVYFTNLKSFVNVKWGTKEPVAFRDDELGLVWHII